MLKQKTPLEQCADAYLKGKIRILNVHKFIKYKNEPSEFYHTTKSAFIFPLSGTCNIFFDDELFRAYPGVVIHGCHEKRLRFHVTSEEPFSYINLYYDSEHPCLFQTTLTDYPRIRQLLNELLTHSTNSEHPNPYKENSLLSQIFEILFQDYILPEAKNNLDLVNEVVAYIQEHYMMDLSLNFISETFGKTSNQLSYLFYIYKGIRPVQYLISCRLSNACHLLSSTTMPISVIAQQVGYEDPLFFSRLFKRHLGCSPKQFRALYSQDYHILLSNQDKAFE